MSLLLHRQEFGDPVHRGRVYSREQAFELLNTWVLNDRLKLHMVQVAGLMRAWALEIEQQDEAGAWKWEMAGLLHDADWDQWPELHCKKIIEQLEVDQIDPEIIRAIASHGHLHFGVEPVSRMDQLLYAFDELSGLIHAYSLMRPGGYDGMEVKGVMKRLKDKAFAANVSRDDIQDACQRAGLELTTLVSFIVSRQGGFDL